MKIVAKKSNWDYGDVGSSTGFRLPNGTKLNVGDIVEVKSRMTNNIYRSIVIGMASKSCIAGFGAMDWDEMKSRYAMRRIEKSNKITGREECFKTFNLKLVK